MAIVAEDFFKERKYPFIFTLLILLICIALFLFSFSNTTSNPVAFYSVIQHQAPPHHASKPKVQELPPKVTNVTDEEDQGLPREDPQNVDFIPCLDNFVAIKALKSRKHTEHRERHCSETSLHCLLPLPKGYKVQVPWPKSRDKLLEYKKDQHWVVKSGEYLVFLGGGTQFKDGVDHYIEFMQKNQKIGRTWRVTEKRLTTFWILLGLHIDIKGTHQKAQSL
ncbi:hypothetical protein VNO80_05909 [Phaseolus coccineus]|uniref:Methyltransferase n=1 Tax=Phaseolus coccineus TaxID=3886 RepID=A0AAN9RNF3_PHACN